ncbi:MAG: alpha/beta fold hydrolase [Victivallaceae bacterium]|nr:alpha/beta fold hydrolase [Victivallaceae bacterium]
MEKNLWKKIDKYDLAGNFLCLESLKSLGRGLAGHRAPIIVEPAAPDSGETTVLIHGLFHRAAVMRNFAVRLAAAHQQCICYDYPTTRNDISGSAAELKHFLHRMLSEHPERRFNLVTHSLGGLIARAALTDRNAPLPPERFNRIVMLAPPNHGSKAARLAAELLPKLSALLVKPLRDLSDAPGSPAAAMAAPERYSIGVIAGSFDKRVTVQSAHLRGQCDFLVLPCGHSFMMYNPEIQRQTIAFLENGHFDHSPEHPPAQHG